MGKFVFLAVLFAALVAVSIAQDVSEQSFRDAQCQHEVQVKPLHACQLILQHHLTGGGREGGVSVPFETEWSTRDRCCQELQSVSLRCRCSAIRGMVRDYEQTMPPLGGGRHGWPGEQQEQGYRGGEIAEHHQQGGGYYGEEGRGQQHQQGQVLHRERPQQQQEAGQGYYGGETAESQERQGGGYYGERPQQQQHGEGFYSEMSRPQQGQQSYHEGAQQHFGRVRLMKMRQYLARLPTSCQIEPMECSVFSADQ